MRLKPLENRIVLKRKEAPQSKGSILLPESAKEKPIIGEVLAVGEGKLNKNGKRDPLSLKIGDLVLFSSYSGTEYQPNEKEEYLIISEEDILAVLN